jgi:hypothetical protein
MNCSGLLLQSKKHPRGRAERGTPQRHELGRRQPAGRRAAVVDERDVDVVGSLRREAAPPDDAQCCARDRLLACVLLTGIEHAFACSVHLERSTRPSAWRARLTQVDDQCSRAADARRGDSPRRRRPSGTPSRCAAYGGWAVARSGNQAACPQSRRCQSARRGRRGSTRPSPEYRGCIRSRFADCRRIRARPRDARSGRAVRAAERRGGMALARSGLK